MLLVWLTVVWVGLWGSVTVANVLGGLLVSAVLLRALPMEPLEHPGRISPVGALRFLAVFGVALVRSSLQVLVLVLHRRTALHPAVVAVAVHGPGDRLLTLVGNSISLTPGTLTLEVDRARRLLYVHVIDVGPAGEGLDEVLRGIEVLERAAGRALGVHA